MSDLLKVAGFKKKKKGCGSFAGAMANRIGRADNKIKVPKKVMKDFEDFLEIFLNEPHLATAASSMATCTGFDFGKQYLYVELKVRDMRRKDDRKKKPNMKDWDKPKVGMTVLEKGEKKNARKYN